MGSIGKDGATLCLVLALTASDTYEQDWQLEATILPFLTRWIRTCRPSKFWRLGSFSRTMMVIRRCAQH